MKHASLSPPLAVGASVRTASPRARKSGSTQKDSENKGKCGSLARSRVRKGDRGKNTGGDRKHDSARWHSRKAKEPTFGDLCEWSEGLAVVWRRKGCTEREMREFIDDDPFVLCNVVPALHALGFSEDEVIRHVPHDSFLAALMLGFSRVLTASSPNGRGSGVLALPPWLLMSFFRRAFTRRIAVLKNKIARPDHYEVEKARRRAMAEERRRITRRVTTSPCPTKEEILDAWRHVRDSKESLVRFGSLMQDLECYVDNSLRFDDYGRIVGRNAGVKGWLRENLPELAEHYCSVIRYKAAAKKLRQIVGLSDPTPVAAILGDDGGQRWANLGGERAGGVRDGGENAEGGEINHGAEKLHCLATPPVEVVRARAIYLEAMGDVPDVAARVMARIDALCDPERTDEVAMLRSWREKYMCAITVRRKDSWWRRLMRRGA